MILHLAAFTWKEGVSADDVVALTADLRMLSPPFTGDLSLTDIIPAET